MKGFWHVTASEFSWEVEPDKYHDLCGSSGEKVAGGPSPSLFHPFPAFLFHFLPFPYKNSHVTIVHGQRVFLSYSIKGATCPFACLLHNNNLDL